jgi:hypothetical protein
MTAPTSIENERDSSLFGLLFIYDEAKNAPSMAQSREVLEAVTSEQETNQIFEQTNNPAWSLKTRARIVSGFIATILVGKAAMKWYADPEGFVIGLRKAAENMVELKRFSDKAFIQPVKDFIKRKLVEADTKVLPHGFPKDLNPIDDSAMRTRIDGIYTQWSQENPSQEPSFPPEERACFYSNHNSFNANTHKDNCTIQQKKDRKAAMDARTGYEVNKIEMPLMPAYENVLGDYDTKRSDFYEQATSKFLAETDANKPPYLMDADTRELYDHWEGIPEIQTIQKQRYAVRESETNLKKKASWLFDAGPLDATNDMDIEEMFATYISRFN